MICGFVILICAFTFTDGVMGEVLFSTGTDDIQELIRYLFLKKDIIIPIKNVVIKDPKDMPTIKNFGLKKISVINNQ